MRSLEHFHLAARNEIRGVFADIDDTLTTNGRLTAEAYIALERLHEAGLLVVVITGRPAGWCDHIARMWPVSAVVGENGAFYFYYDNKEKKLQKRFLLSAAQRAKNRRQLDVLGKNILAEIPGAALASDQLYRESDLAIDFCEDVERLSEIEVDRIVEMMEAGGATAKISSVHVNGWYGTYNKLDMTVQMMRECFGVDLEGEKSRYVFVGDSPNDAPMFGFFPHAVGVANVRKFRKRLSHQPAYVTARPCGAGFSELADLLLSAR